MPLATPYHSPAQNDVYRLGRLLQVAFGLQAREVARRLGPDILEEGQELPSLEHWVEVLAASLRSTMVQFFQQGIVASRRRLAQLQIPYGGSQSLYPQRLVPRFKQLGISFNLFDPRVLRAVDRATLLFCEETNQTAVMELQGAIDELRELLRKGLEKGKALAQLAREIKTIFSDPYRAMRIATTETSRAMHAGALFNAQESKLQLKKSWLASSNACEKCLELDGLEKELDEPFMVDGTGPYARIMHPPLHPNCL